MTAGGSDGFRRIEGPNCRALDRVWLSRDLVNLVNSSGDRRPDVPVEPLLAETPDVGR